MLCTHCIRTSLLVGTTSSSLVVRTLPATAHHCLLLPLLPRQQAMSGDHAAMVRVSHMLLVGYGTRQDEAAAATWMRKAW
jgi:TPR repeat protein